MKMLCTIGYEAARLDAFLDALRNVDAALLVDVRELPLSRRKGFSKTCLRDSLHRAGIDYVHVRELGAPKLLRDDLRKTGDYTTYFRRFRTYLKTQTAVLKLLAQQCRGVVVLMCYERDSRECRRSVIARELGVLTAMTPVHLQVEESLDRVPEAAILHSRKGLSAAQSKV